MRQAVRGEFSMALDSLASEKSGLMNQLSEVRLKLAELQSEHEAAEKQWKVRADEEATKIHARYVSEENVIGSNNPHWFFCATACFLSFFPLLFYIRILLYSRVKAAIHKKDEVICELQRNYDQALAECQHLETLLQRQTKNNYLNQSKPPGRKWSILYSDVFFVSCIYSSSMYNSVFVSISSSYSNVWLYTNSILRQDSVQSYNNTYTNKSPILDSWV